MADIKERPILFSGAMVRAILAGQKTQTRRIVKLPHNNPLGQWEPTTVGGPGVRFGDGTPAPEQSAIWHTRTGDAVFCPYGQPGDRLWIRETWSHANNRIAPYSAGVPVHYRADYMDDPDGPDGELAPGGKYRFWLPSIHMPRAACRLLLEITGIRAERLQSISGADAKAEGTTPDEVRQFHLFGADGAQRELAYRDAAVNPYRRLWEEIHGTGSWHRNPWVWVIEFDPPKDLQAEAR